MKRSLLPLGLLAFALAPTTAFADPAPVATSPYPAAAPVAPTAPPPAASAAPPGYPASPVTAPPRGAAPAAPAVPAASHYAYPQGYPPPPGYGYPPPYGGVAPGYYPPPGGYTYNPPAPQFTTRTEPYTGGPIPEGATLKTERSKGLLIAGGVTFGALYFGSIVYALAACPPGKEAGDCPSNSGWLYVPVIGPFATAADSNASFGGRNLAIFDGVFQLLGAATFIYAMAASKEVLEFREPARRAAAPSRKTASVRVSPIAPGAQVGASISAVAF